MITDSISSDPCVVSLVLFGSHARGDFDGHSDTDICTFVRPHSYAHLEHLRTKLEQELKVRSDSLSLYPVAVANRMADHGSLFLWHLRLEGRLLFDRGGFARELFDRLKEFRGYDQELGVLGGILSDTEEALWRDGSLTEIDLHLLHTVVRNTCILMTSCAGSPAFGRTSAFAEALRLFPDMPHGEGAFSELCRWHLSYIRGEPTPGPLPPRHMCLGYVSWVRVLIGFAKVVLR